MKEFIIESVQRKLTDKGSEQVFDLDTNLIASGLLDSFDFINLLMELEEQYSLDIDFSDLDPSEFTTIKGLVANLT